MKPCVAYDDVLRSCLWPGPASQSLPHGFFVLGAKGEAVLEVLGNSKTDSPSHVLVIVHGGGEDDLSQQQSSAALCRFFPAGSSHLCASSFASLQTIVRDALNAVQLLQRLNKSAPIVFSGNSALAPICAFFCDSFLDARLECKNGSQASHYANLAEKWPATTGKKKKSLAVDRSFLFELEVSNDPFEFDVVHTPSNWHRVALDSDGNFVFVSFSQRVSDDLVLFFHGNGESVTNYCFDGELERDFAKLGWSLCFAEYRGYHSSMTRGVQTVENVGSDARKIVEFVKTTFSPRRLVLYGRSIGSISVIECQSLHVDGIIIESGFSTSGLRLRVEKKLGKPYAGSLLDLTSTLSSFKKGPVMIMHAIDDEVVTFQENFSELAANRDPSNTMLLPLDVGKHNIRTWNRVRVFEELEKYLKKT